MSNKDLCFLGLLALAFVVLDSLSAWPPVQEASGPGGRLYAGRGPAARLRAPTRAGCPRDAGHPARVRKDGAVWCLACDEAFYPRVAEWEFAMGALVV